MREQVTWVELLGVTMSGEREPDSGLVWSDLEGWWGLPDARGEADAIPGAHGRFPRTTLLREARVMTLVGHIYAANNHELHEIRDKLEAELGVGSGSMIVATAAGGLWERGVEIDTLKIDPDRGKRWTKFTVDMVAPDPCRYGPTQVIGPVGLPTSTGGVRLPQRLPWNFGQTSAAARMLLTNSGALPVHPVMRVSGGFESVSIVEVTTGQRLVLESPVLPGYDVLFDSGARRAEVRGSEVTRWMNRRQWFEILPGDTHEYRFEVTGQVGDPQMWAEFKNRAW